MKKDNRRLLVTFTLPETLVGAFVYEYGDKVEGLNISPIVNVPYNKNKPQTKKPKKTGKKGATKEFVIRSMSRNKTQTRQELMDIAAAKGIDRRGMTGVLGALTRAGKLKRSGDTFTYINGAEHG